MRRWCLRKYKENIMINEIYTRRSVRNFKPDEISDENIRKILSAGLSGPSGHAAHPLEMIVIKSREKMEKIATFFPYAKFAPSAPVAILVCHDLNRCAKLMQGNPQLSVMDAAAGIQNMLLMAKSMDIGSCWTHAMLTPNEYKELCNLPENIIPVACVFFGYTDMPGKPRDKFNESRVHSEEW